MSKHTQTEIQEAVQLYADGLPLKDILREYAISRSTLYRWIRQQPNRTEKEFSLQSYRRLKERLNQAEEQLRFIREARCFSEINAETRLASAEELYRQDPTISIPLLCKAMEIPKGTLYNRLFRGKHGSTLALQRRKELLPLIEAVYHESNETYGAGRIAAVLKGQGINVSQKLVASVMHENGMFSICGGAKQQYLQSVKQRRNLLQQKFTVSHPNEVWVSDVTFYRLRKRKYYICVILDLYARKVIAWKIGIKNSTQLTKSTFKAAFLAREPLEGLLFHSDNGSNYICKTFSDYLKSLGVIQSFSKTGTPYDNSVCEAFFHTLKNEELYRKDYTSEQHMRESIAAFMEYYNAKRLHSVLHYVTPDQYEAAYYRTNTQSNNETL